MRVNIPCSTRPSGQRIAPLAFDTSAWNTGLLTRYTSGLLGINLKVSEATEKLQFREWGYFYVDAITS